jgi:hypothetical protein
MLNSTVKAVAQLHCWTRRTISHRRSDWHPPCASPLRELQLWLCRDRLHHAPLLCVNSGCHCVAIARSRARSPVVTPWMPMYTGCSCSAARPCAPTIGLITEMLHTCLPSMYNIYLQLHHFWISRELSFIVVHCLDVTLIQLMITSGKLRQLQIPAHICV